ncbi:GIY-YIG nuclease family protein [bacterium]|nr:MAG: GIY-YIG nuclease family protein [bacterium]
MAKLTTRAIRERAFDLLATQSAGIRFKALVDAIAAESPETPYNTIFTQVGELPRREPQLVARPERGLFVLVGNPSAFAAQPSDREMALYAFVVNGKVRYIGKTRRALAKRMYKYSRFATSQITNERNHGRIRAALEEGRAVDVYALVEWEPIEYRGLPVDLAAGLEDVLIARMSPLWNGRPRDEGAERSPA